MQALRTLFSHSGWRGRGLDFILGGIAVLGLAPFHIYPLSIFALSILAWRLFSVPRTQPRPRRSGFGIGFWFGLGYFLCGTFWIGSAFISRGPEYIWIMPPMILALGALLGFFWGLAGYLYQIVAPSRRMAPFIFMALFTLMEILRGHIFTGFPWNLPGYIFEAGGPISQIASLIGIYGLTMLTFLLAGFLGRPQRHTLKSGLCVAAALAMVIGFGVHRLNGSEDIFVPDVNLRIVQVPFKQSDQFDRDSAINIVNQYLTATLSPGLEDITHVIWPEGAAIGLVLENQALMEAMSGVLLSADDTPPIWLLNSLREESRSLPNGDVALDYYNSSAAISFGTDGSATLEAINDKAKLVPFGEYIPGGKWLEDRKILPLTTALASISAAEEKTLADFPGLPRVSPQLCYEIIFPHMTPRLKENPAKWILNQSNDAWFGSLIGPHQHANQARYRAIEEGVPVIRAAANGLSGSITPYGKWIKTSKIDEIMAIDTKIPNMIHNTHYSFNLMQLLILINGILCLLSYKRWTYVKLGSRLS
ncbi:MAG: apolipoprotein N-acyltransferase [Maricaulaceae bacterium]